MIVNSWQTACHSSMRWQRVQPGVQSMSDAADSSVGNVSRVAAPFASGSG